MSPLISCTDLIDRSKLYKHIDQRRSLELAHYTTLYKEEDRITVAMLGLSSMWVGVNARLVQEYFTARGGKEHRVVMLGANHPGEDLIYMMTKDLLSEREVDLIVLSAPNRQQSHVHPVFHRIASYDLHGEIWKKLDLHDRATTWSLATIGAPLQFFNQVVERNEPGDNRALIRNNGSWVRGLGWRRSKFSRVDASVIDHALSQIDTPGFHKDSSTQFQYSGVFSNYQETYFRATVEEAYRHGTKVAVLSTPIWPDRKQEKPVIRIDREILEEYGIRVIGLPPSELFGGMNEEEIQRFYYDSNHFNANGSEYFTRAISPALWSAYDES